MPANGGRDPATAGPAMATADHFLDAGDSADPQFVVGVIDTGIVLNDDRHDGEPHPFLRDRLTSAWPYNEDRLPDKTKPKRLREHDGHGTAVAGLILREAPTATIHMRNVLDEYMGGNDPATAKAIRDLRDVPHLKVVNLSFNGTFREKRDDVAQIKSAVDDLLRRDIVVVAAAGNRGTGAEAWPAAFPEVIAVGAVDETVFGRPGQVPPKASFSNYGPWVDAYASGVQVLAPRCWYKEEPGPNGESPQDFTGWARMSGTSFAAAIVTGVIARHMIGGMPALEARKRVIEPALARVRTPGLLEDGSPYIPSAASRRPD
jgi:subtilisin family serine protease